ncbi:MAG TPA: enoyl-CoA hydratase-related protein [Candidatus Binataceae bacterium]|nr:enoyl-CoA hydratase-related protein [Candidatus Binataceae bacterium]
MGVLLTEIRGNVAYLTMNRPQVHNALNPELMVSLARAWHRLRMDDRVRVVVLTGAGDKAFSAGADLDRLIPLLSGARAVEDEWDRELVNHPEVIEHAVLKSIDFFKPVISAVNGFCVAGGMEMMLASDIRVAVDSASFGLQEVIWGIAPLGGSLARLPRQMPWCKAMEVLLTGSRFDAQEAWRLGLVNYVVPREQLTSKAEQFAATIAENGPLAVRIVKEGALRCAGTSLERSFAIELELRPIIEGSEDAREGPRAFLEKRKPVFKGR